MRTLFTQAACFRAYSSPIRAELLFGSGFCPLSKRNEAQCDASSVPGRLLQRFLSPCASVQSTRSACLRLQRSRSGTGAKPLLGSVLQGFARRDRERGLRLDRSASPRSAARKPQGASQSPLAFGFRLGAAGKRCARPGSVHASESGGVSRRAMLCHVLLRLLSGSSSRKPAWSLQLGVQNPRRWQDLTSSLTTIYRDLEKKATEGCRLPEPLETLRAEAAVEFIQGVEQRNTEQLICGTRKHSESPFGCASVSFWVRLCRLVPRTRQDSLVTETESPLAASRSLFPLRRSGVGNPAGPCGPRGPNRGPGRRLQRLLGSLNPLRLAELHVLRNGGQRALFAAPHRSIVLLGKVVGASQADAPGAWLRRLRAESMPVRWPPPPSHQTAKQGMEIRK